MNVLLKKLFLYNPNKNSKCFTYIAALFNYNQSITNKDLLNQSRIRFQQQCVNYSQQNKVVFKKASKEVDVPTGWGLVKVQVFGDPKPESKAILALHGYLDNSNSFLPLSHYLTKHGYYMIAVDLPGHGFSSQLPVGVTYTPKIMLTAVRRVVKYFHLKNPLLLGHSYGSMLLMMYSACYPQEADFLLMLDPVINPDYKKRIKDMAKLWSTSIDTFIEFEDTKHIRNDIEDSVEKGTRLLTREVALEKLLKANKHLDENSANILLERALIVKDNKLEFSRDRRWKHNIQPDHFVDFYLMSTTFNETIKCQVLYIYAWPPSYGERYYEGTMEFISKMKEHDKNSIESIKFDGTHHFHMIEPDKTSKIILNYLNNKLKQNKTEKKS